MSNFSGWLYFSVCVLISQSQEKEEKNIIIIDSI